MRAAGTLVEDLMTSQPVTLAPDDPVVDALGLLERYAFRHLPVEADNRLVGIVSDRDLLWAMALPRGPRAPGHGPRRARTVAELLRAEVRTVGPDTPARAAVGLLLEHEIGALPVVTEARRLVGIVTATDFLRLYGNEQGWAAGQGPGEVRAGARMSHPVRTAAPDDDLLDAAERLLSAHVRHLPVVRDGAVIGMLSDRDVRRTLARLVCEDRRTEAEGRATLPRRRVGEVCACPGLELTEDAPLRTAARLLIECRIGALPILRAGALVGILSATDLLRHYREHHA